MPSPGSTTPIFQQILQRFPRCETIKCRNTDKVESLLAAIAEGTENSLQVITDFDFTLSKQHNNGQPCQSSYGVFDHSPLLPLEFRNNNIALFEKYHPIEICHEMSIAEKIPHMIQWYDESHKALISQGGITQAMFQHMIKDSNVQLRDNATELLQILNKANVPVLIFSAGIGDILQGVIDSQNSLFPNIKIVSNWMEFDNSGILTGFKMPIIHTFNKNESVLGTERSYFEDLSHRPNAILLGDSIGDVQMSNGMPNQNGVLKIGFLNMNIEQRLESFLEAFDIVILDDQSMDFVNLLLSFVLQQTPQRPDQDPDH